MLLVPMKSYSMMPGISPSGISPSVLHQLLIWCLILQQQQLRRLTKFLFTSPSLSPSPSLSLSFSLSLSLYLSLLFLSVCIIQAFFPLNTSTIINSFSFSLVSQ
uniref:Uncharacterized protein n=1 Tax=Guillardia theta TaxID=55529 RepID=A0A6U6BGY9_GUITH